MYFRGWGLYRELRQVYVLHADVRTHSRSNIESSAELVHRGGARAKRTFAVAAAKPVSVAHGVTRDV